MTSVSISQVLPPLLVKSIINHVAGPFGSVENDLRNMQDKSQLSITLPIGDLDKNNIHNISPYYSKYIKHATILLQFEQTTNGIAAESIENYHIENASLVYVHNPELTIQFDNRSTSITETKHSVDEFLTAIARFFPNMEEGNDTSTITLPKYEGIAPFPRLETLRMYIRYPFSDDLVFRGNRKTLRELYILADSMIMHILCNAGVFAMHRMENLRQLSIADIIVQIGNIEYAIKVYLKIISNTLPYLDTLFLADTDIAEALPEYLETKAISSNIRILDMPDSYMQLPCVLSLLKSLPTLQRLRCMISSLGSGLGFTSASQVESYMQDRFHSMSTHLKRWDITNDDHFPENVIIASILLVAALNPQLEAIVFARQNQNMIGNAFEKMLSSRLFSNYKKGFIPVLLKDGVMPMIHIKRSAAVE
ncbi:hypothetical protein COEREDRAFT_86479 [Coemansia reversa NRRL 1564]|uniref:F-box domain-containing protein n=1 Tax=Coemansia reversa (strain ATCC 12441 / NRRL 1564) TaxID=763665 RepID=A0A2G5BDM2_COERN|nr:hypothetical protein COEREDRAFT_86479 [Coemansia reversa NRRL 1564]|eukprot:PIA17082.1 hypothetical protein COEREDRAFT_86479 [Coemansia reversa NRRL 1564]